MRSGFRGVCGGGGLLSTNASILRGVAWTAGTYSFSIIIRFGSNVVLARLLSPELFGALLIINTIRQGIELSSDIGLPQNVVQNKAGNTPAFYNTVWTIQIIRGVAVGAILFLCAGPIAQFYLIPRTSMDISAAILAVSGLASTSIFLLHRNMQLAKLNLFELAQDAVGATILIVVALFHPTIEALLIGVLLTQTIRVISSHFLRPEKNRLVFDVQYALEVVTFGRWIFLASILSFLCANFDRLYIGRVAPLAVVGIYGIARTLADVPGMLAARIGYSVVFPVVSSAQMVPRDELRTRLSAIRFRLLLLAAVGISFGISIADGAVRLIYDARYHDAAWMLPLMLLGVWISMLCVVNEYAMLGFGKPSYNVVGNGLKLAVYFIVIPLSFRSFGMLGAIVAISSADVVRYLAIACGSHRQRFSFFGQDLIASLVFIGLVILMCWSRSLLGFGTPFDGVPAAAPFVVGGELP